MKKLIKSGVCGTHEQCIYARFTKDRSTVAAKEKKKEKKKKRKRRHSTFKVLSKHILSWCEWLTVSTHVNQKCEIWYENYSDPKGREAQATWTDLLCGAEYLKCFFFFLRNEYLKC